MTTNKIIDDLDYISRDSCKNPDRIKIAEKYDNLIKNLVDSHKPFTRAVILFNIGRFNDSLQILNKLDDQPSVLLLKFLVYLIVGDTTSALEIKNKLPHIPVLIEKLTQILILTLNKNIKEFEDEIISLFSESETSIEWNNTFTYNSVLTYGEEIAAINFRLVVEPIFNFSTIHLNQMSDNLKRVYAFLYLIVNKNQINSKQKYKEYVNENIIELSKRSALAAHIVQEIAFLNDDILTVILLDFEILKQLDYRKFPKYDIEPRSVYITASDLNKKQSKTLAKVMGKLILEITDPLKLAYISLPYSRILSEICNGDFYSIEFAERYFEKISNTHTLIFKIDPELDAENLIENFESLMTDIIVNSENINLVNQCLEILKLHNKINPQYYKVVVEDLFRKKDFDQCLIKTREALKVFPNNSNLKEILEKTKNEIVKKEFFISNNRISISSLNFKQRFYLTCFIRALIDPQLKDLHSIRSSPNRLANTPEQEIEVIRVLYESNAIKLNPKSDSNLYKISDNGMGFSSSNMSSLYWSLNLSEITNDSKNNEKILMELFNCPRIDDNLLQTTGKELWIEISKNEILAYLRFKLEEIKLGSEITEKEILLITNMCSRASTGQISSLINHSSRSVSQLIQSGKSNNKKHSQNYFWKTFESKFENYINGPQFYDIQRPPVLDLPMIPFIFYEQVLRVNSFDGFKLKPDWFGK